MGAPPPAAQRFMRTARRTKAGVGAINNPDRQAFLLAGLRKRPDRGAQGRPCAWHRGSWLPTPGRSPSPRVKPAGIQVGLLLRVPRAGRLSRCPWLKRPRRRASVGQNKGPPSPH